MTEIEPIMADTACPRNAAATSEFRPLGNRHAAQYPNSPRSMDERAGGTGRRARCARWIAHAGIVFCAL
jgi:hypothetical protein